MTGERSAPTSRAQSHVVGVSLMIAITVIALGGLTVAVGEVVQSGASAAEADRVADGMATVADPSDVVGGAHAELRFGDGELRVENRTVRVIDADTGANWTYRSDALVYEVDEYAVVGASNAVLRAGSGGATMVSEPSIVADRNGGVLAVGVPEIDGPEVSVSTTGAARVGLRTRVEHDRVDLGQRAIRIAVETPYPRPWAEYFETIGADVVERRASYAGDRYDSVVAEFDGQRQTYVVVHDAEMEVVYP